MKTQQMPYKTIWVFNGAQTQFSGGVFDDLDKAEFWIKENNLTGLLTAYPLNQGTLDWAIENNMVNITPEKLAEKQQNPHFVAGFTSASMEHYHYEEGKRVS